MAIVWKAIGVSKVVLPIISLTCPAYESESNADIISSMKLPIGVKKIKINRAYVLSNAGICYFSVWTANPATQIFGETITAGEPLVDVVIELDGEIAYELSIRNNDKSNKLSVSLYDVEFIF